MRLKSNVFRLIISFCLIIGVAAVAFADTIRLKDGSVIKGKITGFREGQFQVQIGDGPRARQMAFFADEIEAIEFDSGANLASSTSSPSPVLPRPTPTQTPNPQYTGNADNKVIIVGQGENPVRSNPNPQTTPQNIPVNNPPVNSNPTNRPTTPTTNPTPNNSAANNPTTTNPQPTNTSARPKPIQLNLKVLADNTANGWTNAGWVVKKGQKIRISSNGRISLGKGNYATPAGMSSLADKDKLMPKEATGGLIAVIGDDNNDFVFIGNLREFTATRDGALFLGINEANLDDNSGAFDITIEIDPGTSK